MTPFTPKSPNNINTLNTPIKQQLDHSKSSDQPSSLPPKSSFVYEDVLQDVVAYVEVRSDLEDLSALFGEHLLYLGASVSKTFNKKVTHVVFKNGRESTFKKAKERKIPIVNVLWLDGCKKEKCHIPEEPFIIKEYNTYGKRKRLIVNSKFNFDDLSKSFEASKKIVDEIKASRKSEILAPETPVQPSVLKDSFQTPNVIPETVFPATKTFKFLENESSLSPIEPIKRKLFSGNFMGPNETKLYDGNVLKSCRKESTPNDPKPKNVLFKKRKGIAVSEPKINPINPTKFNLRSPLKDQNIKKTQMDDLNIKTNKKLKMDLNQCENDSARPPKVNKPRESLDNFKKIKWKPKKMKSVPSIVFTSFSASMIEVAYSIVKSLGNFQVTNNVGSRTTHVICGEQKRTLNVLYGLVQGCYLLSTDWLMKSLEAGKWVEESPFEIIESYASAEVRKNEIGSIFKDCGTFFISPDTVPPADDLSNLILMGGGSVTSCLRKSTIIVGNFSDSSPKEKYNNIARVNEKYILDCISGLKKFST